MTTHKLDSVHLRVLLDEAAREPTRDQRPVEGLQEFLIEQGEKRSRLYGLDNSRVLTVPLSNPDIRSLDVPEDVGSLETRVRISHRFRSGGALAE